MKPGLFIPPLITLIAVAAWLANGRQTMSRLEKEDLLAALDEIAGLDLPAQSRLMLEQMLVGPLCQ
ncbi:MAG: hypothetical protein EOP85_10895, partial [Verrucomicrobiaceae bacterium]